MVWQVIIAFLIVLLAYVLSYVLVVRTSIGPNMYSLSYDVWPRTTARKVAYGIAEVIYFPLQKVDSMLYEKVKVFDVGGCGSVKPPADIPQFDLAADLAKQNAEAAAKNSPPNKPNPETPPSTNNPDTQEGGQ